MAQRWWAGIGGSASRTRSDRSGPDNSIISRGRSAAPVPALARRAITVSGLQVFSRCGLRPWAANHRWMVVNRPEGGPLVKIGRPTRLSGVAVSPSNFMRSPITQTRSIGQSGAIVMRSCTRGCDRKAMSIARSSSNCSSRVLKSTVTSTWSSGWRSASAARRSGRMRAAKLSAAPILRGPRSGSAPLERRWTCSAWIRSRSTSV
ncbi:hypothetical protein C2U72_05340 [Prosthecomicrobium hirschii]|nr:hypothetical protein C2U72_05340 [Prosthecomicrobium hirschii]